MQGYVKIKERLIFSVELMEEPGGHILDPNINKKGRLLRGIGGSIVLGKALFLLFYFDSPSPVWRVALAWLLLMGGLFMIFEAFRGWCILRAFGRKTPI